MHKYRFLFYLLLTISGAAVGGSTINPNLPAPNSLLSSVPVRANFAAAYSDINNLFDQNNGGSAPLAPVLGQLWLNTSATPYVLEEFDGASWVAVGDLNAATHNWIVPLIAGGTGLTSPGSAGNLLTSTGAGWVSSPPATNGTVTNVAVANANGFTGSIATPGSTPLITLSTTVGGLLMGSSGSIVAATSGIDYAPATSGSSLLKGNAAGGFANALSGADYAPATSGSSLLYGNGLGGFSNATVGGGLSLSSGVLGIGAQTGSGSIFVMANSPTLITPNLGTPSTLVLTNATGTPAAINLANGSNYPPCSISNPGLVPLPPNNTTTFLRGDCTFAAPGGTPSNFVTKTSAYSASINDYILADTSGGGFTITLPSAATEYAQICFLDAAGTFGGNTLTIANNGLTLMGAAANMTVTTSNASFCLVYYNATYGWRIK